MKPIFNILFINASILTILYIFFGYLLDLVFYLPPFIGILAAANLGLGGFFLFNGEKKLGYSFLGGFLFVTLAGLALLGYVYWGVDRPWEVE